MTIQAIIESLLEKEIGLSTEAIGAETISKAIYRRMNACGLYDAKDYLNHLLSSQKELENLIEMSVIPETWFFRNKESFAFLARYVRTQWLPENRGNELRILSIPCSTGEEPYSIAMTLIDTGLMSEISVNRLYIEARDISGNSLRKARLGIYGRESFRGKNLSFRDRHFDLIKDASSPRKDASSPRPDVGSSLRLEPTNRDSQNYKWQMGTSIKNMVRFKKGNLTDEQMLSHDEKPYHIIFCRNLLIYLSESGKRRALKKIESLLSKNGVLFVGHVERSFVCSSEQKEKFSWIRRPGVFACQRSDVASSLRSDVGSSLRPDVGSSLRLEPANRYPNIGSSLRPDVGSSLKLEPTSSKNSEKPAAAVSDSVTSRLKNRLPVTSRSSVLHEKKNGFNSVHESGASETAADVSIENPLDSAQKLADQGDLYEALKICEKCLTENSFHIQANFLMGLICHALDDEERAEEYFNKAVYLDPNHYEALNHLAFIMEHRGEKNRAVYMRQRAQRILQREEKENN